MARRRLGRLAWYLDDAIPVPGTSMRFGLDAVVGLIPGVGDAAGLVASSWILVEAVRQRVSIPVLLRMAMNLGIDALVGLVPLVGDLADAGWKADAKNVRLLDADLADRERTKQASIAYVVTVVAVVIATIFLLTLAAVLALYALLKLIF